jgi:hypothetical protein
VPDGLRVLLYVYPQVDSGSAGAARGVYVCAGEGREMGEREGEVCCYGAESVGRDGGAEKGHGVIVIAIVIAIAIAIAIIVEVFNGHLSKALERIRIATVDI